MDSNNSPTPNVDVYSIVTNRIIELLEKGTVPWQKPWVDAGIPMNAISKRPYRGINLWLLLSLDYPQNLFLTWDQLKKIGGSVKQGEHGHVVVFWKTLQKKGEETQAQPENQRKAPLLRYYKVFNVEQCRDLPENLIAPKKEDIEDPIASCETIINGMPNCPAILHKESKAYYDCVQDFVNMPKKRSFKRKESYYATLFHELVHSTGHENRLNRKSLTEMAEFGSEPYSIEELVAELGAAYLLSSAGILQSEIGNNAAYIQGWLSKLKNDKRFIVQASGQAQRAVDFINNKNLTVEEATEEAEQPELIQ